MMFFLESRLIWVYQIFRRCGAKGWVRLKACRVLRKSSRPAEAGQVIVVSQWKHSRTAVDSDRQMLPSLSVGLNPTVEFSGGESSRLLQMSCIFPTNRRTEQFTQRANAEFFLRARTVSLHSFQT